MAFGKEMEMMGGKTNLKPAMHGKPEGKPKGEDKPKEESKGEHDAKKHFHVSHDGLSYQAHGEHEDGSKEEPQEHMDLASAHNHMDQFFGGQGGDGGEAMEQPPQHHMPMMGGFGG